MLSEKEKKIEINNTKTLRRCVTLYLRHSQFSETNDLSKMLYMLTSRVNEELRKEKLA